MHHIFDSVHSPLNKPGYIWEYIINTLTKLTDVDNIIMDHEVKDTRPDEPMESAHGMSS